MFVLFHSTPDHARARRQAISSPNTTSHQYNTTMPAVGWNTHFGENNISVDLHRGVYNSFEIRTGQRCACSTLISTLTIYLSPSSDPFSSSYRFSIHDSASFTANLLLNDREEHTRFLRTDLCLSGQVSYDTNILTVCVCVCVCACVTLNGTYVVYWHDRTTHSCNLCTSSIVSRRLFPPSPAHLHLHTTSCCPHKTGTHQ